MESYDRLFPEKKNKQKKKTQDTISIRRLTELRLECGDEWE